MSTSLGAWKLFQTKDGEEARDFDKYFTATDALAQSGMIEHSRRTRRPWYLQSLKAELGVESSGELGLLGLGGEGAVELIWTRNPVVVAKLVEESRKNGRIHSSSAMQVKPFLEATEAAEFGESEAGEVDGTFDTAMSAPDVERQVDEIVAGLSMHPRQRGNDMRILDMSRVRRELLERVRLIQPALSMLASAPADWTWRPYKFQLELFVEAAGKVTPIVELGAVTRVRLEWNITPRSQVADAASDRLAGIAQLAREMELIANGNQRLNQPFRLAAFKAGIGFGGELDIAVAELKGHAIGSVFFKRIAKQDRWMSAPVESAPLRFISGNGVAVAIPAEKFNRGIRRAAEIVSAITQRAARHEARQARAGRVRQFELGAIEVELALESEGGLFLPTVTKQASLELFFVRGGSLGSGSN
jgi:hypothetical protein